MSWRLAESLDVLRKQINEAHPNRNKAADGTIGDEAHQLQGSASDHNPWIKAKGVGVVTALDITHDPKNGVDIDKLSDELIASRDPRIKYVIANGLIAGPYTNWQWQQNSGHYNHIHISVNTDNYDDNKDWNIGEEEMKPTKDEIDDAFNFLGVTDESKPKNKDYDHYMANREKVLYVNVLETLHARWKKLRDENTTLKKQLSQKPGTVSKTVVVDYINKNLK